MDERKFDVLRAIIEDYVATQEPIGSKSLVERHNLKVSPATIRNEMAVLEEEGFIVEMEKTNFPRLIKQLRHIREAHKTPHICADRFMHTSAMLNL